MLNEKVHSHNDATEDYFNIMSIGMYVCSSSMLV